MPPDDSILSRQTPHSPEAERAVLGSIFIDPNCFADVINVIGQNDFYSDLNRDIFATLQWMFNFARAIDPVTALEYMRERGVWNDNAPQYIYDLIELTPTSANVMAYANIIRDMALLRAIAEAGTEITQIATSGEGGAENILDLAESRIYALRQGRNAGGLEPISKVLVSVFKQISEAAKRGSGIPGVPTGLSDLDNRIMGMNNSDLIIIASRPGMGKTSIALNIALHAAQNTGKATVYFSLEMSREQLAMRLLSSESKIDNKKLQTGRLSESDWRRLSEAAANINRAEILLNDDITLTVARMNAMCKRVKNLGLVVIDYLGLIQSATDKRGGYSNESHTQVVSDISRMLKVMAKELNVPVVCACQLNRANEGRQDKRPTLSDMRDSGSIEQDADVVLGLYREDYYDKESENVNVAECIVLKNRRGELGRVMLRWSPEFTTYSSLEREHVSEYG